MVGGLPLKKMTTKSSGTEELLFKECFYTLKDPRRTTKGNIKYSLEEIVFLTMSAVISGFQTYELIEGFGEEKIEWLRKFYPYKYGAPSYDTLRKFYSRLNPKEFSKCLIRFTESLAKQDTKVIDLDGKTVKGFLIKEAIPCIFLLRFAQKTE